MSFRCLRTWLFLLSAETAHKIAFFAWRLGLRLPGIAYGLRHTFTFAHPALHVQALGLTFPNPVGLAAGFDKNAVGYNAMGAMGFGFVEIGTVTPLAQAGNPKPRLFRLPEERALINRLGFNNDGAIKVSQRLTRPRNVIVGVNIGKNKKTAESHAIDDYIACTQALAPYADYLVVNVSSPNTPGLRDLQSVDKLRPLLTAVRNTANTTVPTRHVPLLMKIAPDLDEQELDQLASLALELRLDGIIATNTTVDRNELRHSASAHASEQGGVSGAPLKTRALSVLRRLKRTVGDQVVLIACGGIETAEDVRQRLAAGATLVQLYTGLVYHGPSLPSTINRDLLTSNE